jgi:hypothetical protein
MLESRWKIPYIACQLIEEEAELPSSCQQKCEIFNPSSLKRCVSVYSNEKSKDPWKTLKRLSGSSHNFTLSNSYFKPNSNCATVPLNLSFIYYRSPITVDNEER